MKYWKFPAGEIGVQVQDNGTNHYELTMNFKSSDCIMKLLLEVDAIRRVNKSSKITLNMQYVPYARQDRVMSKGESHSLKVFCKLINDCSFEQVNIVDPHSSVTEALLDNLKILQQHEALQATISLPTLLTYDYLVAPDVGALKKIYETSKILAKEVIAVNKVRELNTGKITTVELSENDFNKLKGKTVLVVDDICDGGATFLQLAKVLPTDCTKHLYVTHGIFSKGKEVILSEYSKIFCYNDISLITSKE